MGTRALGGAGLEQRVEFCSLEDRGTKRGDDRAGAAALFLGP